MEKLLQDRLKTVAVTMMGTGTKFPMKWVSLIAPTG